MSDRKERNLRYEKAGVIFEDIEAAYIDEGVTIGKGTYIGPGVVIKGNSKIGEDCKLLQGGIIEESELGDRVICNNSVIAYSKVGDASTVGPFANIRPGSELGSHVRVGNFVEIKNSIIGDGTKISHLTYVGDSDLGRDINIGCGVVFVNYDGLEKHRSTIHDGAFIGCNTNLISPVTVGERAYIAAGTTVTSDVPSGALAIDRSSMAIKEGWVDRRGLIPGTGERRDEEQK